MVFNVLNIARKLMNRIGRMGFKERNRSRGVRRIMILQEMNSREEVCTSKKVSVVGTENLYQRRCQIKNKDAM